MSQFRVQIDISFATEQDAIDLMNYIENIKPKTYLPKKTEKIECHRIARYHQCTHDDKTPTSCNGYIDVDFTKPKQEHKVKEAII